MENLSLQVSVLQIYVLLSVVLIILSILIIIYLHYCFMLDSNLSSESETSIPKSYSCRDFPENEDVNPKRRASYPFSYSAMQIATTEGPSKAYNVETRNNSTGSKKKKHCKLKSSTKPETITPTLLSTVITIWMPPHSTASTPSLSETLHQRKL
ncbi:hypothetical protein HF521_020030 [Silurus meridionalis]|uniref:Uncharacterized protein n=1 Tax=Silurus meridionalis TaxID=175797 RepID=A0A8T0BMW4_SILME|nr:hypothetical protein HF521_020030 [Silurus meridionalis]